MAQPKIQLGRDPAFDGFLGAVVGEDKTGASVTVLSMLARLDVDPWREASELSSMPEAPAQKRLEALLARFKDVPALVPDQGQGALALLDLLPRRTISAGPSAGGAVPQIMNLPFGAPAYWIIATVLFLVWTVALTQEN
jgi:hypothetical protein